MLRSSIPDPVSRAAVYDSSYGVLVLEADARHGAFVGTDGVIHDRSAEPLACSALKPRAGSAARGRAYCSVVAIGSPDGVRPRS